MALKTLFSLISGDPKDPLNRYIRFTGESAYASGVNRYTQRPLIRLSLCTLFAVSAVKGGLVAPGAADSSVDGDAGVEKQPTPESDELRRKGMLLGGHVCRKRSEKLTRLFPQDFSLMGSRP